MCRCSFQLGFLNWEFVFAVSSDIMWLSMALMHLVVLFLMEILEVNGTFLVFHLLSLPDRFTPKVVARGFEGFAKKVIQWDTFLHCRLFARFSLSGAKNSGDEPQSDVKGARYSRAKKSFLASSVNKLGEALSIVLQR